MRESLLTKFTNSNQLLLVVNIISTLILLWIGFQSYSSLDEMLLQSRHTKSLLECAGSIRYLDEVLTNSVLLAASSGDLSYIDRYHYYEPILDSVIKESIRLEPAEKNLALLLIMDSANVTLVRLEHSALEKIHNGDRQGALDLIHSREYELQKNRYAKALDSFVAVLDRGVIESDARLAKAVIYRTIAYAIVFILLLVGWVLLARFLSSSRQALLLKNRLLEEEMQARTRIQEELRESENRLKSLYENVTIGLYRTTPGGEIIHANARLISMLGFASFDELARRDLKRHGFEPSYERDLFIASIEKDGKVEDLETPWQRKDGSTIFVKESAIAIRNPEGKTIFYDGFIEDITEKKKAEELLRKSEALYKNLVESSQDLIWQCDSTGRFTFINEAFIHTFGYTLEDIIGKRISDFQTAEYAKRDYKTFASVLQGTPLKGYETVSLDKAGNEIVLVINAQSIRDAEGIMTGILGTTHIITERKRSEEALKRSVSLLDATLESTDNGILAVDTEGRVLKANGRFAAMWRIPPEVMESGDDEKLLAAILDQLSEPGEFIAKVKALYNDFNAESFDLITFTDGRVFERVSKPMIVSGTPKGRVWSFLDVTERKKAEEKIKMFVHTVKSINDIVNIADLNDDILFVNPAFCKAYGYTEDELVGKPSSIFWSSRNPREVTDKILPATLAGGWQGELWNRRKDGSEFLINLSTSVIRNDSGAPIAVIGLVHDITQLKEYEKQKESLYQISEAVNQTKNIDDLYKRIHEIVKELMPANNFYIALYDESTDMISFPYFIDEVDEAGPPFKPGRGCTEYVLRTGEAIVMDNPIFDELVRLGEVDLSGTPSEIWLGVPLKLEGKTIGVMVVQDYTNKDSYGEKEKHILVFVSEQVAAAIYKKRAEESMRRYTMELVELNATKNRLFSIIAHDLRSPFNYLLNFTEMMADQNANLSAEEIKKLSQRIYESAQKIFTLVVDLLEWAQMQTGSLSFSPAEHNLNQAVRKSIDAVSANALQKGITLVNDIREDQTLVADIQMISTVLRNLISNAVKFTRRQGQVTITAELRDSEVQVSVADTGIGMPEEICRKLFKMGEKVNNPGTEGEPSTGLGLLLCKDFIEKHGGRIWVESQENQGSTFHFTIPQTIP